MKHIPCSGPRPGLSNATTEGSALIQLARYRGGRRLRTVEAPRPILLTRVVDVRGARLPAGFLGAA